MSSRAITAAFLLLALPALGAPAARAQWTPGADDTLGVAAFATAESLLASAERRQKDKDDWSAAWAGARVLAYCTDSSRAGDAEPQLAKLEERTRKLLAKSGESLSPEQLACLGAWWGAGPELSWAYAEAMSRAGRSHDAAAEALGFLARYPHHRRAKDAADLVRRGTAGGAPGLHQSVYHVAALLPLSGPYQGYGQSLAAGLTLALEWESSEIGRPIRLTVLNTRGEAWTAARAADQALHEGAGILVGEALSVPTLVVAGMANGHGVPLFSPAASEERVGEVGELIFQTGLSELEQGRALARYAIGELRLASIAVAIPPGDSLGNLAAGFAEQATAWGNGVIRVQSPGGTRDFRAAVDQLRRESVDGLLLPEERAEAELWMAAVRREGYPVRLLGSELLDPQALHEEVREGFEDAVLVGLEYALPDSIFAALDTASQERFGFEADAFVRRGYLTGRILGLALRVGIASPHMMQESVSQRLVESAPGHPARRFVRWGEHEAVVPIYLVRRGELVRAR